MAMTYGDWLRMQTPERQAASRRHMRVCRLYGEAQRRYPFSARTERLRAAVRKYYEKHVPEMAGEAVEMIGGK